MEFLVNLIMTFIAKMPVRNAVKNATTTPTTETFNACPPIAISTISIKSESTMIGIDIRKENFVTSSFLFPQRSPPLIVVPDLETPGNTAKPCATPIKKADLKVISFCFLLFASFSLVKSKTADTKKQRGNNIPENDSLMIGIRIKHKMQVGIVATTIIIDSLEKGCLIICQTSFLKTMRMDKRVATCKIMLTNKLSSTFISFENKTKCPEDETGKNSVSPWTSPKKNKARIFI